MSQQRTRRSILGRAVDVSRTEGVRGLWFRILGETVYRRVVLMERLLDHPIAEVRADVPAVIELLQPSEAEEYARFRPGTDATEVRRRLAAGQWAFVARHQDRIVHAGWAMPGHGWIEYLGCTVRLAPDEVYQYDSFTAPGFRGHNLAALRVTAMARHLRQAGYRRLIAVVVPENARAFRPLQKAGYRAFGMMGSVRIGRWRHTFRHVNGPDSPDYWDNVLARTRRGMPIDEWRAHMRRVYARLIREWLPPVDAGRGLKTDLFEEAVTPHYLLPALGSGSVGLDGSPAIVAAARERLRGTAGRQLFVVGDLRRLPLRSATIGRILCGSSLDHFRDAADIGVSLTELARVLAPKGVLVVTLDNPHNPVVWLRNRLPFTWLHRLRLVPYYVGETYGRTAARRQLESLGLEVTDVTAIAHAPRAPAIWSVALVERMGWTSVRRLIGPLLDAWEGLERCPTRFRTGYYLALRAEKSAAAETHLDPRSGKAEGGRGAHHEGGAAVPQRGRTGAAWAGVSGSEISDRRRYATGALIVLWLAVQIAVPLLQKLDLPTLQYRYARYSWAMFSRLAPRYEVSLFRTRGGGDPEPIPDIGRYVRGYRSPAPMPMIAVYSSEDEVHDRFARLVTAIARDRRDGYSYVASIRWTAHHRAGAPDRVEFRADAVP